MTARPRRTDPLFQKYYFQRPGFLDGTTRFHALCSAAIPQGSEILEIGAGPANATTQFIASIGRVTGLDVGSEVMDNSALAHAVVYDGAVFPFESSAFDACVSNYVVEHVRDPAFHFREVARVLRPGGVYALRTPNLLHYVAFASSLLPHGAHVALANRMRGLPEEAHDPWPTVYRANRPGLLTRLAASSGMQTVKLESVEAEPSYGRFSSLLFYPMMAYERLVNASEIFAPFRASITAVFRKA